MVIRIVTSVEEDGTVTSPFEDSTLLVVPAASRLDPEILALKEATLAGFLDHKSEVAPQLLPYKAEATGACGIDWQSTVTWSSAGSDWSCLAVFAVKFR